MSTNIFYPVTLTLDFDLLFKYWNLAHNFWTVSAKLSNVRWVFYETKHSMGTNKIWNLWPWPWSSTRFLKTSTLITFEHWEPELWYFTYIFVVIRPIHEWQQFWSLRNFYHAYNIYTVSFDISHVSSGDRTFPWKPIFRLCDLDLGVQPTFWKLLSW